MNTLHHITFPNFKAPLTSSELSASASSGPTLWFAATRPSLDVDLGTDAVALLQAARIHPGGCFQYVRGVGVIASQLISRLPKPRPTCVCLLCAHSISRLESTEGCAILSAYFAHQARQQTTTQRQRLRREKAWTALLLPTLEPKGRSHTILVTARRDRSSRTMTTIEGSSAYADKLTYSLCRSRRLDTCHSRCDNPLVRDF